jgi:preprotein translocase subunit SecD
MRTTIPALALLLAAALLGAGCGAALGGVTAPGTAKLEFRLIAKTDADGLKVPTWDGKVTMFVEKSAALTDRDVEQVKLSKAPDGKPAVALILDQTAKLTLEDITSKNIGRRIAVLVDGKIVMAPTIKEKIEGGHMTIAGFGEAETKAIYDRIKK